MSGDRGPHFLGKQLKFEQSTYFQKYHIPWRDHHLCANHAFSRADGAGIKPFNEVRKVLKAGGPELVRHAGHYCQILNNSELKNHLGFWFKDIDQSFCRDSDKIVSLVGNLSNQKRVSLVKYTFLTAGGAVGREEGICLTKETSSDSTWTVQSLLPKDLVEMCWICSQHKQRPVRHRTGVAKDCLVTKTEQGVELLAKLNLDRQNLPQPPALRSQVIFGDNLAKLTQDLDALPTPRRDQFGSRRKPVGGSIPFVIYLSYSRTFICRILLPALHPWMPICVLQEQEVAVRL
jgi:hypothetical protein